MNYTNLISPSLATPRVSGDIDLLLEVTKRMRDDNYPLLSQWLNEPIIQEASNAAPKLQRFLISRSLRMRLGASHRVTSLERFVLDGQSSDTDWLAHLSTHVIPALIIIAGD